MKQTEKKYRITLSERQLHLIINCVEDIHRFMGGQAELDNCTAILKNSCEVREALREVSPLVVPELYRKYGKNASYGWNGGSCPNEHQKKFLAETYYIYRELRHQLTIRNTEDYNVYHSETLRCENSGEPIKLEEL